MCFQAEAVLFICKSSSYTIVCHRCDPIVTYLWCLKLLKILMFLIRRNACKLLLEIFLPSSPRGQWVNPMSRSFINVSGLSDGSFPVIPDRKAGLDTCYPGIISLGTKSHTSGQVALGPISLTSFPWQFKFYGNFILQLFSCRSSYCNKLLNMTAQLSCHVQNFVAITLSEFGWEQNKIFIVFELWWKSH